MKILQNTIISLIALSAAACNETSDIPTPTTDTAYGVRSTDNSWPVLDGRETARAEGKTTKNYYIVVDNAKSMKASECIDNGRSKLTVAKEGLSALVNTMPEDNNVAIMGFNDEGPKEYTALGNSDFNNVLSILSSLQPSWDTSLSDAVMSGYKALEKQAKQQLGYGEYHLILLTDNDSGDSTVTSEAVKFIANTSPIAIHAFSVCGDAEHALNAAGVAYRAISNQQTLTDSIGGVLQLEAAEPTNF